MGWIGSAIGIGVGFVVSGMGYQLGSILLIIIGILIIEVGMFGLIHREINKILIRKYTMQIGIKKGNMNIAEFSPSEPKFWFELITENKSNINIIPIEGEINIWDGNKKFAKSIYNSNIKELGEKGGTKNGLYFRIYNSKNWRISVYETIPLSLKKIPTYQLTGDFVFNTKRGRILKNVDFEFELDEKEEKELLKKLENLR